MLMRGGAATAIAMALTAAPAIAQSVEQYEIAEQDLASALKAFAAISNREVIAPSEVVAGKRSRPVDDAVTAEQALRELLGGTGLRFEVVGGAFIIRVADEVVRDEPSSQGAPIVVTGSRIRGAQIASPVIRFDQEAMRNAGHTSLTSVVRSIPQAFGGGQNFGVGANVGSANGIDVGGAVTINLRGLGSDATLTLLNGHRLAYNGSRQGIDVSAIPFAAVDRIEILADGASALYGSDAVAGVANIVLKRDFDGVQLEAEGGVATDGGYSRQRYSATTGTRWADGGVILSYEYARSTELLSDERSFTRSRPGVIIHPPLSRNAAVLAAHQTLSDDLTFEIDLLFNRRKTEIGFPDNPAGDLSVSHTEQPTTSRSFAVSPSFKLDLSDDWSAELSGVYGNERVFTRANNFVGETLVRSTPLCYCNDGKSIELSAEGGVFALPGGQARLAVGGGYRTNLLHADRGPGHVANIRQSQDSYYGYGELNLPLVSPDLDVPAVHRLNVSAALRYERYPGVDSVVTPKVGVIYAPADWLDLKASWGHSFRAPTLLQQYQVPAAVLYPADRLGGASSPSGSTALLISGGNTAVTPERARTLTATVDLRPPQIEGARLQVSYFQIRYIDRIVSPIALTSQSLSNPAYAELVTFAPGPDEAARVIAGSPQFVNASGAAVDPANIVAIVDNRYRNAGRQSIRGVDILGDYTFPIESGDLTARLNASYLRVRQQLGSGEPVVARSGLLFTPPDWRVRGSLTWSDGPLMLNGSVNFIDGVDDTRNAPAVRIDGVTTLDITGRYRLTIPDGPFHNLEFRLSLLNALNDYPAEIASRSYIDATFDSTNYSPLGRVVTAGITASW